ncbi:putative DNA-binding domain-containing protein [Methylopila henanensis]|uniref:DNA-binding domain-containing protein n=1 Tax=Methylopila henanensis TaxID=873516 RepID=A0ABW4K913_9HYPH
MGAAVQSRFAAALRDPAAALPPDLALSRGGAPERRFAVYRNNVAASLRAALETRFPASRRIVGDAFFAELAGAYAREHPPRSAVMMAYGDGLADFAAAVPALASAPYVADVMRIEAARTRAYHAADAEPLGPERFAAVRPEELARLHVTLHPSLEIVRSAYPALTIWAMNAGERELAPIVDWTPEDALVVRPALDVVVRRLPAGGAAFLGALAAGRSLGAAARFAGADDAGFDLTLNLAGLIGAGLVVAVTAARPRRGGRIP